MSIEASFEGVNQFLKENEELVEEIRGAVSATKDTIESLADRVRANRAKTEELTKKIGKIPFKIAKKGDTKDRQKELLKKIEEAKKKIEKHKDDPTKMGLFQADLSSYYLELGNTYLEEPIEQMVTFNQVEADEIGGLLQSATLDSQKRENLAAILDAAVQISKVVLKVAVKLAA
jgi:predicted  nucleic acid-binding Zn-ribbon protein